MENYGRRTEKKFKNYRITAKNSVEHVHPQKERFGAVLQESYLHAFVIWFYSVQAKLRI
jgi:hypothetical protein